MNNGPEEIDENTLTDGATPTPLEVQLRRALRPEDPPSGFADRVLARAGVARAQPPPVPAPPGGEHSRGRLLSWPMRRPWVSGAIAAALVLGCFEAEITWQKVREQERRVAQATAQFQTTERVTVHALAQAREQLQRAGVSLTLD